MKGDIDRPIRVLFDLSLATLGYSGIPHEARLLFRMFCRMPGVEVTGLLYSPGEGTECWRPPRDGNLGKATVSQSIFLERLFRQEVEDVDSERRSTLGKLWGRVLSMLRLAEGVRRRRIPVMPLSGGFFADVLWRNIFSKSWSPEDYDLVANGRFVLAGVSGRVLAVRTLTRFLRQPFLPTRGFDFFITEDVRPFDVSGGTKCIARYHDMIPLLNPDLVGNAERYIRMHHALLRQAVKRYHFSCISAATRDDLLRLYPGVADKAEVIPNIVPARKPSVGLDLESIVIRRRSSRIVKESPPFEVDGRPYILCVGGLEPKKNWELIAKSFDRFNAETKGSHRLIMVSGGGWSHRRFAQALAPMIARGDVIHLADLDEVEMTSLYAGARLFFFPSLCEGFGLPPVEALRQGTRVLVSDLPIFREVLGDMAAYCNPRDVDDMVRGLREVVGFACGEGREDFRRKAEFLLSRYDESSVVPLWRNWMRRIVHQGGPR